MISPSTTLVESARYVEKKEPRAATEEEVEYPGPAARGSPA
jgi:hypothetical protein